MSRIINRVVKTANLQSGMVLARDVYSSADQVLLSHGTELTPRLIAKLKELNIQTVRIRQELPEHLVDDECKMLQDEEEARNTYVEAIGIVKEVMDDVRMGETLDVPKVRHTVSNLCNSILKDDRLFRHLDNLHLYDGYTFAHSIQVSVFTIIIGKVLNCSRYTLEEIGTGGMLHDIGKTKVPLEILNLPRQYTSEEFAIMKAHPQLGEAILQETQNVPELVVRMAGEHHERFNGTGYYKRLKGNEIHPYSQITSLADVYDAMTTTRTYRTAMLPQQATEYLLAGIGTSFDPDLCQLFTKHIAIFPIGCMVELTNGAVGKILEVDDNLPTRPIIGVMEESKSYRITRVVDLRRQQDVLITRAIPHSEVVKLKRGVEL